MSLLIRLYRADHSIYLIVPSSNHDFYMVIWIVVLDQQASNLTPTYVYSCATRRDKKCFGRQPGSIWGGLTCGGGSRHFSTLERIMKVFQELFCNHVGCRQKIGISQAERGIQERGKNIEQKPGSAQPSSKSAWGGPREMRVKPGGCAVRSLIPCPHLSLLSRL